MKKYSQKKEYKYYCVARKYSTNDVDVGVYRYSTLSEVKKAYKNSLIGKSNINTVIVRIKKITIIEEV